MALENGNLTLAPKVVRITIATSTNLSTNIETKVLSRQMTHVKKCSFAQIMHGLQHKRMKVDPPNSEKVNSLDKNFGRRTFNYAGW